MTIPANINSLLISGSDATTQYQVSRSLRFNSADSAYLTYTPTNAGNRRTWTWSGWVKRSTIGTIQCIFEAATNGGTTTILWFSSDDMLNFENLSSTIYTIQLKTNQVFRDVSSWYHIVLQVDTTHSTTAERVKIYVNNSLVNSFSVSTYPSQNVDTFVNSTIPHGIGRRPYSGGDIPFAGYIAETHFIDGLALTPSDFTETDLTTGELIPKQYTGVYAGNSFYLPFSDNSSNTATTIGRNESGIGKIAYNPITSATGALPIYNVTDNFGTTKSSGTRIDTNSSSLVLALTMDGANNGTTFTDLSSTIKGSGSAKTVTANGDAKTLTSESIFYGSSGYFDGTGDYLSVSSSTDFAFGTGDFTVEGWVYITNLTAPSYGGPLIDTRTANSNTTGFCIHIKTNGQFDIFTNSSLAAGGSINQNSWNHICVTRKNGVANGYLNGSLVWSVSFTNNLTDQTCIIGTNIPQNNYLYGYIQDLRIYKGVAKYTTNFVPSKPAGGLPIYNTTDDFGLVKGSGTRTDAFSSSLVLALPMDGTIGSTTFSDVSATVKGSGSNKTPTVYGNSQISREHRFYGSSGYFDGSGDYLNFSASDDFAFGTGDFTVEFWYYHISGSDRGLFANNSGSSVGVNFLAGAGGVFRIYNGTAGNNLADFSKSPIPNTWQHIAVVRRSGLVTLFLDGNSAGTTNWTGVNAGNNATFSVGSAFGDARYAYGYIQDFRVYKGVAKYDSIFVPPTRTDWTPLNLSVATGGPTSIAAASGALPIHNTTDTYGATKGSGTRTDSFSSKLVLAIPMDGTNNGTSFSDLSATIKGSGSAKTITNNGSVITSTTQSKFYGSSGYISNAATQNLSFGNFGSDFLFTGDYTIECWVYPTTSSATDGSLFVVQSGSSYFAFNFDPGTQFNIYNNSGSPSWSPSVSSVINGQWNHFALTRSGTTQMLFVNGILTATNTSSGSVGYSSPDLARIGGGATGAINSYIQDFRIYKDVAKYTGNFNPVFSTQFPSVAVANDSVVDSPTSYGTDSGLGNEVRGNYCTLNPNGLGGGTLSDGNLEVSTTTGVPAVGTIAMTTGKWYWEVTLSTSSNPRIGVFDIGSSNPADLGGTAFGWCLLNSPSRTYNNGVTTSYGDFSGNSGDIVMLAYDANLGRIWYGVNGSWLSSGNPATNTNPSQTSVTGRAIVPASASGTGTNIHDFNFGQRPFAYTAPSGFKALCDTNLPEPSIVDSSTAFDAKIYTGNGGTQSITGLKFSPDLFWNKSRNNTYFHNLIDTIRGGGLRLSSNNTAVEDNGSAGGATPLISTFNSDGVTFPNANLNTNDASTTYVAWMWDAGTSTVTNTSGTIQSQVRANPTAGISVVTYSGNSTVTATVGHGLNTAPSMILFKRRNAAQDWGVYHTSGGLKLLQLNTGDPWWNGASNYWYSLPTSSVFYPDNTNGDNYQNVSGGTYVAYCFAAVPGFSAFGTYTGNASTDGPFVYTGFRPKWVLWKKVSASANVQWWALFDSVRIGSNNLNYRIHPNVSNQESTDSGGVVDILSNGFKLRSNDVFENENGSVYVYAAFAENPFKYARAR